MVALREAASAGSRSQALLSNAIGTMTRASRCRSAGGNFWFGDLLGDTGFGPCL